MPTSTKPDFLYNSERLRLIATVEIVAFYSSRPPEWILGFSLPYFIALSIALNARPQRDISFSDFITNRARRILLPWVFWCVVFGLIHGANILRHSIDLADHFSLSMVLYGTSIHLWFLPFLFAAQILCETINRVTRDWSFVRLSLVLLPLVACVFVVSPIQPSWIPQPPAYQWGFGLAVLLPSMLVGRAQLLPSDAQRKGWLLFWTAAGCILTTAGWEMSADEYRYRGMAIAALGIVYLVPGSSDRITEILSPLSYGIYLIHPVFVLLLQRRIFSWPALTASVVVLSVLTCLVLHRTRLKAVI